ncbi:E3 ubiquitin protein ligase DRIP2-like isoform X2 [Cynara cardunculus var. scolymus]|nr:E3 ubiquitin protein ligase DRIP2-like isoform X2 [Cynara cardunculus var. scolymus]
MSNNQVVKIPRDAISACMTCPICNKLFRDATTIPECLHTFCRKCIHKKLTDEELECCPICNIDLGCVPLEKLSKPDHNLQDIRAKIFPSKRRRVKAPEVVPSVTLPLRRKERSLSSLVVSTPRVSTQTTMTGKRSKAAARKKLRGPSFSVEKSVKNEEDSMDDHQDSSSSREISNKLTQNLGQNSSTPEPSSDPSPDKETKNGSGPRDGKVDLWKPLNYLVEVANRSKSSKFTSQSSAVKSPPQHTPKSEGHGRKPKGPPLKRSKFQDENGRSDVDVTESAKPKKIRKNRKNKADMLGESDVATLQAALDADANNAPREKRINPIWFHLVPSEEQEGEPLGQIEGSFVRLKDGNIPVSIIQKFVMSKLKLGSENEVELRCMGQPLVPSLLLGNLMELWLQTQPTSQTVSVVIGSSAKEYMMEILYARKGSGLPPSAT